MSVFSPGPCSMRPGPGQAVRFVTQGKLECVSSLLSVWMLPPQVC